MARSVLEAGLALLRSSVLGVVLCGCVSPSNEPLRSLLAPAPPSHGAKRAPERPETQTNVDVDLAVSLDLDGHRLAVVAHIRSLRPRRRFFLNSNLAIETLKDALGAVPFTRTEGQIDLARPTRAFEIRYGGPVAAGGTNDSKGRSYLEPSRVRLTEVGLWYPVFYDGPESFPWPPEPVTGRLAVTSTTSLHWAAPGRRLSDSAFAIERPSDLTLVGVRTPPRKIPLLGGRMQLNLFGDAGGTFAPRLGALLEIHAARIGSPRAQEISVVVFPTPEATNALGFVSSTLVVLNTKFADSVLAEAEGGTADMAHEFAHLWFGADLRAEGPAALWLAEGFAEYYGWRALRDLYGADAYGLSVSRAETRLAGATPRLDQLGVGDRRVYWRGPLALHALAVLVTEQTLDSAIRALHERGATWSVDALFAELARSGVKHGLLHKYRETWGV